MTDEMFMFYKNAIVRHLCTEWQTDWKKILGDDEKLFSFCLMQQSIPYFATAVYEGWGLTEDYLKSHFKDYINGNYTAINCDGVKGDYTYRMYVDYLDKIICDCHITHLLYCESDITIPQAQCPIIYISNKSKITINSEGFNFCSIYLFDESEIIFDDICDNSKFIVYKYSDKCKVIKTDRCKGQIKEFQKELRIYE
jgi:hypothetical protein